ncbi:unnamed protein product [Dracunculus medinensis]|uniref:Uncharacterized protein n=1 Tax=Dracunculus medinensis TaxID=318479 RepID=A0A3P7QPP6_DRAME|nr:unnamed protein product [Dracunculus medinensis]
MEFLLSIPFFKWVRFVKFGNAPAREMAEKNLDKRWLKDGGVIDAKNQNNDWSCVTKFRKNDRTIEFVLIISITKKKANFSETQQVLVAVAEDRARSSKKDPQDELDGIIEKLAKLEAPSIKGASKASADGVYSRLTDHTKYTGAHKERFDAEGKGKGKAGREDIKDDSGYVAAYKNKDTYHKTHS